LGAGEELQVVTFTLAAESYGIEIGEVQEIIPVLPIIRVPESPAWIEGLVDLRGTILPVIDLRKRFGLASLDGSATQCIIVVNLPDQIVGLMVDAVRDVARLPVPPAAGARARFLSGIARVPEGGGHRLLLLLDLARMLTGDEVKALVEMT
jgi:purine-binding chemotaxis protein CheW